MRPTEVSVVVSHDTKGRVVVSLCMGVGGSQTTPMVWHPCENLSALHVCLEDVRSAVLQRLDAVLDAYIAEQLQLPL